MELAQVLTLVCEGETDARKRGFFPKEDAITAASFNRAAAMAARFQPQHRAFCGPERAGRQTAEALALTPRVEPLLAEIDYGLWAGGRIQDVAESDPLAFSAWLGGAACPQGETLASLFDRVHRWLDAQHVHKGRTIAVVSPNVIRALVLGTLGLGPQAFANLDIAPLTVSELTSDGRNWRLRCVGASHPTE